MVVKKIEGRFGMLNVMRPIQLEHIAVSRISGIGRGGGREQWTGIAQQHIELLLGTPVRVPRIGFHVGFASSFLPVYLTIAAGDEPSIWALPFTWRLSLSL